MDSLIQAKNLNFTYNKGKDNEYQALININLEIFPGEYIIIFGPSGCGKSTLLNVFAGLETPDSGSIVVSGHDIMKMTRKQFIQFHRRGVGMVYQAYNLITSLTVEENVALPQLFVNVRKRKRREKAMELLSRFGIDKQANKIPTELSGGQQQRIGIARAIVNDPYLVLADEPVGNLDSVSSKNVLEIFKQLNEVEKKTIVLVTHNPENLEYGDRIIHMKDGMITREVINRQKHSKSKFNINDLAKPPSEELMNLLRAYQGLTPEQINILIMPYKAKVFTHHFITSRSIQETKIFEDVMQRRLLNTITQDEFRDVLNRNGEEGGVGFDSRIADKIVKRINRVMRMALYIQKKARQRKNVDGSHDQIPPEEKAEKVTIYLLKTCYDGPHKEMSQEAMDRLILGTRDRILNVLNHDEYYKVLDMPIREGGVGLNSKTARAITEELELILILGFGAIQNILPIGKSDEDKDDDLDLGDDAEEKEAHEEKAGDKSDGDKEKEEENSPEAIDKNMEKFSESSVTSKDNDLMKETENKGDQAASMQMNTETSQAPTMPVVPAADSDTEKTINNSVEPSAVEEKSNTNNS